MSNVQSSSNSGQNVPTALAFTCNMCRSTFGSNELQRAHMHTDHHRYNIKRKIALLPPISLEVFEQNFAKPEATTDNSSTSKDRSASTQEPVLSNSSGSASLEEPSDQSNTGEGYQASRCLFCNHNSATLEQNLQHMQKAHGMFIPDQDDLEDAEGLLVYLFSVISKFHECLYCGKVKDTANSIRDHMIDKGHCMIAFDEELEQFYDFAGEETDEESKNDEPRHGAQQGRDSADLEQERISPPSHDFHPDSDHELHLPSGRVLGHRSLSRYYRQNLHSYPTPAERAQRRAITSGTSEEESPSQAPPGRQLAVAARGEMGMIGIDDFGRRALRATEQKAMKQETRVRNHFEAKVNKEANHQQHYRPAGPGRING